MLELREVSLEVGGRSILENVRLRVDSGEVVALLGPSGSGKTTLLNSMCGIARPSKGAVFFRGVDLGGLRAAELARTRLRAMGIVFQYGELLPELSLVENVALPSRLLGVAEPTARAKAVEWLDRVGLPGRGEESAALISGGETQRVAIARALAHGPVLLLADEPTGMLDEHNTGVIAELLMNTARQAGAAVVLSTHDPLVAAYADRSVRIHDGRLEARSGQRDLVDHADPTTSTS